jgi:hypothetical protein
MQLRSYLGGRSMWQREEDHIMIGQHIRRCLSHHPISQWKQVWVMPAQECSGIGACRHRPNLHLGMCEQQSEQLSARISRGTRHGNSDSHLHEYAMCSNFMHFSLYGQDAPWRPDNQNLYTVRWTAPVRSAATATAASRAAAASASVSVRSGARNLSAYASDFFASPICGPV